MSSVKSSNEEIVTKLLSDREILTRQDIPYLFDGVRTYDTNPNYDLSEYLKKPQRELSRFGPKYIFVK